jgi:hypothetical protein
MTKPTFVRALRFPAPAGAIIGRCAELGGAYVGMALVAMLLAASASGQGASSEVVFIRVGDACGMCAGRYSTTITSIEDTTLTRTFIRRGDEDTVRHKPRIEHRKLSRADWDDLRQSVDSTTLAAFVGRIGCPGCADGIVEWVEVGLRNGTRKTVEFEKGLGPPAVRRLVDRVEAIVNQGARKEPSP